VNQKLKDALMAYKGSNGDVIPGPDPESSSAVILSSSSEGSSESSSSSSVGIPKSSSSSESIGIANVMPTKSRGIFYDARSASLVIGAADIIRLDIVSVDGRRVDVSNLKKMGDVRVLDMSSLRAGIYIVRLSTSLGSRTMKLVKNN